MASRELEIPWEEEYVLAENKEEALRKLLPSTEDYYFYHILHKLTTSGIPFDKETDLLWTKYCEDYRYSARRTILERRIKLIQFDKVIAKGKNPDYMMFNELSEKFAVSISSTPPKVESIGEIEDEVNNSIPSTLDEKSYSTDALLGIYKDALGRSLTREGFEHHHKLLKRNSTYIRDALSHLASYPNKSYAVSLISKMLSSRAGDITASDRNLIESIIKNLSLDELKELKKSSSHITGYSAFVTSYLKKLHPTPRTAQDPNFEVVGKELLTFAKTLPMSYTFIKLCISYHLLVWYREMDLNTSSEAKKLFLDYVQYPRAISSSSFTKGKASVFYNQIYLDVLQSVSEAEDKQIIEEYLIDHFSVNSNTSLKPYNSYLDENFLLRVVAHAKLFGGGDQVKWCSKLPSSSIQELKERVCIDFLPCNKTKYKVDEEVVLHVSLKNVTQVITKVFEINSLGYYIQQKKEIDTSINLDGLIASEENVISLDVLSPFQKVRKTFSFPSLNKLGIFVIEIIGNGISSRALIRKGELHYLDSITDNGHILRVVDGSYELQKDASVRMDNIIYKTDENGNILLPFGKSSSRKSIIISTQNLSSLTNFQQEQKSYSIQADISVDRETLLPSNTSKILIHPKLLLNNSKIVELSKLKSLSCTISTTSGENGTTDTKTNLAITKDSVLFEVPFTVPPNITSLSVQITGIVDLDGDDITLSSQRSYDVNSNRSTNQIVDCFLRPIEGDYIIVFTGRNGEPQKNIQVSLSVKHIHFQNAVKFTLKSDVDGCISLGKLNNISNITVSSSDPNITKTWNINQNTVNIPSVIHAFTDEPIIIPIGETHLPLSSIACLSRMEGSERIKDYPLSLNITGNQVSIAANALSQGTYKLFWRADNSTTILRLMDRKQVKTIGDWKVFDGEFIEYDSEKTKGLGISSVKPSAKNPNLNIQLSNFGKNTRVNVVCTQFLPPFFQMDQLQQKQKNPEYVTASSPSSFYTSGRELSDEYRYIIYRKYSEHLPHLLLQKPTLFATPWAKAEVQNSQGFADPGTDNNALGDDNVRAREASRFRRMGLNQYTDASCCDFLSKGSVILSNLAPNKKGLVRIPFETLRENGGHYLQIIAVDDDTTVGVNITLPMEPTTKSIPKRNLSIENTLDLNEHFAEKSQISVVSKTTCLNFSAGVAPENFSVFDSLTKLFEYYKKSCIQSDWLESFEFLLQWPKLPLSKKKEHYSENACHELNFFLFIRDNEFFESFVKPHIELKKVKTFLDYFLLQNLEILKSYTVQWRLDKLNLFEKILLAHSLDLKELTKNLIDECTYVPKPPPAVSSILSIGGKKGSFNRAYSPVRFKNKARRTSITMPSRKFNRRTSECMMFEPELNLRRLSVCSEEEDWDDTFECSEDMYSESDCASLCLSTRMPMEDIPPNPSVVAPKSVEITKKTETVEYEEQHYYHTSGNVSITAVPFWSDFIRHLQNNESKQANTFSASFISRHLTNVGNGFSSIIFALSILDLPTEAESPNIAYNDSGSIISITAKNTPLVVNYKELAQVIKSTASASEAISVVQCVYRDGTASRFLSSDDDFLPGCCYTSRIVIMNSSTEHKEVELLFQIPQGSIALKGSKATSFTTHKIGSYETSLYEVHYYFPSCGEFTQYPPHISIQGATITSADPRVFVVVQKLTNIQRDWNHVSRFGKDPEVLEMLKTLNVTEYDVSRIAWRLTKEPFFTSVIEILRSRHIFNRAIWSWAFTHKNVQAVREFLESVNNLVDLCGYSISSSIITIDDERIPAHHQEYDPLITARAHQFGARRKLLNDGLRNHYTKFLTRLCYQQTYSTQDLLELSYFLLLMNRQDESYRIFSKVNFETEKLTALDSYFIAYMHFLKGELRKARQIAKQYNTHPVERIKNRFKELLQQIKEVKTGSEIFAEISTQEPSAVPALSFSVADKSIEIVSENIQTVTISYYLMDIEFLFSSNPFVNYSDQNSGMEQFSLIKPTAVEQVEVPKDLLSFQTKIPEKFVASNIMIEVAAEGIHRSCPYFAHSLRVHFAKSKGLLQVTSQDNKPLSKTYVKVYSQSNPGSSSFYKDGYTDPRGIFDYLSLTSDSKITKAKKFSILLISEENGSVIHEVNAPGKRG